MTVFVVLDTTVLRGDMALRSGAIRQLLAWVEAEEVCLRIPEVVIREYERHYSQAGNRAAKQLFDGVSSLNGLNIALDLPEAKSLREVVRAAADKQFVHHLARLLQRDDVRMPLPDVPHDKILQRQLAGRQPFNDSGDGYRDTLIWHSLIELCSRLNELDVVAFVTGNHKDFCDEPEAAVLADELASELEATCSASPNLIRYPSLSDAIAALRPLVSWSTEPDTDDEPDEDDDREPTGIPHDALSDLIAGAVAGACDELLGQELAYPDDEHSWGLPIQISELPRDVQNPTMWAIDPQRDTIEIQTYDEYEGGTVLCRASIDAEVTLDGFMFKSDYYSDDPPVDVMDSDWNDYVMWVTFETRVRLTFQVTATPGTQSIEDVTLDSGEGLGDR